MTERKVWRGGRPPPSEMTAPHFFLREKMRYRMELHLWTLAEAAQFVASYFPGMTGAMMRELGVDPSLEAIEEIAALAWAYRGGWAKDLEGGDSVLDGAPAEVENVTREILGTIETVEVVAYARYADVRWYPRNRPEFVLRRPLVALVESSTDSFRRSKRVRGRY